MTKFFSDGSPFSRAFLEVAAILIFICTHSQQSAPVMKSGCSNELKEKLQGNTYFFESSLPP